VSISQRLIVEAWPCPSTRKNPPVFTLAHNCSTNTKPTGWGLLTLATQAVLKTLLAFLTWRGFDRRKQRLPKALRRIIPSRNTRSPSAERYLVHPAHLLQAKVDGPTTRTISSPTESAPAPASADWLRQPAPRAPDRPADTARSAAAA